jgi:cyanophycinase
MSMMLLALFATSGKLFLAGGGTTPPEIVDRFIKECGGPNGLIVVIPLASAEPEKSLGSVELLKEHGAKNLAFFGKSKPTETDLEELKAHLQMAKGIWMGGGVQERIVQRLGKPWIDANLVPLVKKGLHVYGTSAGSMVCAEVMITGPGKEPDTAETGPGLGLTTWVIDTHFGQRKREGRLRHALKTTERTRGIGINEREWIVIQDDKIIEKHGEPLVIEPREQAISGMGGSPMSVTGGPPVGRRFHRKRPRYDTPTSRSSGRTTPRPPAGARTSGRGRGSRPERSRSSS